MIRHLTIAAALAIAAPAAAEVKLNECYSFKKGDEINAVWGLKPALVFEGHDGLTYVLSMSTDKNKKWWAFSQIWKEDMVCILMFGEDTKTFREVEESLKRNDT